MSDIIVPDTAIINNGGASSLPLATPDAQTYINNGNGPQIAQNTGTVINGNVYILDRANLDVLRSLNESFNGIHETPPDPSLWASLSDNLYNIFVLDNESYMDSSFCMPYRFSLPDGMMDPFLKKKYIDLDDSAVQELCMIPCVFAHRNDENYKKASPTLAVAIGRLKKICPQTENIKFVFEAYKLDVGQQLFNDYASELGLIDVPLRNELDTEHWSIKSGNLKGFMSSHGIIVE